MEKKTEPLLEEQKRKACLLAVRLLLKEGIIVRDEADELEMRCGE